MPFLTADTDRWLVSARAGGELLTTRASVSGLDLELLGPVEGYRPPELQGWLQSLAQSVAEGVGELPPGDPVPPMLREALGGLLFSRAEVWNRGIPPCAIALVSTRDRIGFGWVGEASVEVFLDGARLDSEWVSIRDPQGREARAWCGSPRHDVRIELAWSPTPAHEPVRIEARWTGTESAARATPVAAPAEIATPAESSWEEEAAELDARGVVDAPQVAEPVAELDLQEGDAPSTGVARWLAQHLQWAQPPVPGAESVASDPSPETRERLPESIPESSPESIPPTPEPQALTDAAIVPELPDTFPEVEIPASEALAPPAPELHVEPERRRPPPRHPQWPDVPPDEAAPLTRHWKPALLWAAVVLALFGIGWWVGSTQEQNGAEQTRRPSGLVLFLRRIGLAPQRYDVVVTSRPPGAWIAIDGKELSARTPSTLELPPGEHRVELSFPDLGSAAYRVTGGKNDRISLDAPLWGSLEIPASDPRAQVEVALDGQPLGFVPIRLDSVAPGPHELRFTSAGSAPWGSTIEVRVGETREVLAYPLQSPATGVLQVRATQSEDGETAPLEGARIWVDGVPRGVTPLTLELSRGPHSVRVAHQRESAPIQVIDLPGGNQRFATFEFGLRSDLPELTLKAPATFTVDDPGLVSATLSEIGVAEVREMWLHVRTPENRWRRYPMTLLDAQGSVVGAAPFPIALMGEDGQQLYYVSALTTQGDEIFTEMQTARGPATVRR